MLTLVLPHLIAGRDLADAMVDRLGALAGEQVVVDGRAMAAGNVSFGSQLVVRVLSEGEASELVLVGAPEQFVRYVCDAAERLQVAGRLRVEAREMPAAARS